MEMLAWLLFLSHVPATSSSLRVQIWRHLRAAGAVSLHNGVWVLPQTATHAHFLHQERDDIIQHGGTALLFVATPIDQDLVVRFQRDRDDEYAEVIERCQGFRDELTRESTAEKWTFAELEENEQDFAKLERWLAQIQARDFFAAASGHTATAALESCRQALTDFAQAVYAAEGVIGAAGDD